MNRTKFRRGLVISAASLISAAIFMGAFSVSGARAAGGADHSHDHSHDESAGAQARVNPAIAAAAENDQSIVKEGVEISFHARPVPAQGLAAAQLGELADGSQSQLLAGADIQVRISLKDAATGNMLSGLRPAAWMDMRKAGQNEMTCKQKIEGFVQGTMSYRPEIDLNTWYALVLNDKASITVIDPLLGFGGQKTIALVLLDAPGEDWVASADHKKVYVTLPEMNRLSIVDTATWKVAGNVELPGKPRRVRLQSDGRYLWITLEATPQYPDADGVAVVDTASGKLVASIATGKGRHDLAIADGDRFVIVTNAAAGTASLIDVAGLKKVKDIPVGKQPVSVAYSGLSKSFYVADETGGTITVVAADRNAGHKRIKSAPGLRAVGVAPGGRWVFATNILTDKVEIYDSSTGRLAQSLKSGGYPYQVSFTDAFAYIRTAKNEKLGMVSLAALNKGEKVALQEVTAGRSRPGEAKHSETAAAIVASPEGNAVLVTNPLDRSVYYYMEGMSAASGSFSNENRQPRGAMAIDKSLVEGAPGKYESNARLPAVAGTYDVAILLDSPRIWHCFTATVHAAPGTASGEGLPVEARFLVDFNEAAVGQETAIRFQLTDRQSGKPKPGVKDLTVLSFIAPGVSKQRTAATDLGDGLYEVSVKPSQAGVYYVFVESASLGVQYRDLPFLVLRATNPAKGSNNG